MLNCITTAILPEKTMELVLYFTNRFGVGKTIAGSILVLIFVILTVMAVTVNEKEKKDAQK